MSWLIAFGVGYLAGGLCAPLIVGLTVASRFGDLAQHAHLPKRSQ